MPPKLKRKAREENVSLHPVGLLLKRRVKAMVTAVICLTQCEAKESSKGVTRSRQGKQRPVEDIDEDELVPVNPFQQEYKTWADLDELLKQYI
ncbi:hypothetical protein PI124_g15783 [Phytophthora idaei]|nr:hypothetical protein PI125_g15908 [Phytophthora idaei]KAG3239276.1 hypothetical protein PI124_g15783 [Phytophthora idaei]